jgi:membrane protein YdbS with pleckstrin-like domain
MEIAMSKTRQQFPLSERKPLKKTIPLLLIFAVGLILVLPAGSFLRNSLGWSTAKVSLWLSLAEVFLGAVCFFYYLFQTWYFQVYFYDLTDDFIIIRKRVFTPREVTIPYERVQDVYVDQDLLDRIMGLYDVHLSSATISSGMEAHIDGLEKQAADGLKIAILEKVSEKIKRAKSPNI